MNILTWLDWLPASNWYLLHRDELGVFSAFIFGFNLYSILSGAPLLKSAAPPMDGSGPRMVAEATEATEASDVSGGSSTAQAPGRPVLESDITTQTWPSTPAGPLFTGGTGTRPAQIARAHADHQRWKRFADLVDAQRYWSVASNLAEQYAHLRKSPVLFDTYVALLEKHLRRPTPVLSVAEISAVAGLQNLLLKREDQRDGADTHLMNAYAQVLVARYLGRSRVVSAMTHADTGLAVAKAAATLGVPCQLFVDADAPAAVYEAIPEVQALGGRHLSIVTEHDDHDCRRAAVTAWVNEPDKAFFVSDVTGGPRPHQTMVLDFQSVIGQELLKQCDARYLTDIRGVYAPSAAGMAAFGFLEPFMRRPETKRFVTHDSPCLPARFSREHQAATREGTSYVYVDDRSATEMQRQLAAEEGIHVTLDDARSIAVAKKQAMEIPKSSATVVLLAPSHQKVSLQTTTGLLLAA